MLTEWDRWFPGSEPIAYELKWAFPDRWVRFHSLPGSKRYPENEAEYATVLERHKTILGELTQPGPTILLTTGYSDTPQPIRSYEQLQSLDPDASPWRTVAMHEHDPYPDPTPNYWYVYASKRAWRTGAFDPLIRLIADDVIANVMIVAPDCRWLLHPYDGGMDVIAESTAERDRLKAKYADWLWDSPGMS